MRKRSNLSGADGSLGMGELSSEERGGVGLAFHFIFSARPLIV